MKFLFAFLLMLFSVSLSAQESSLLVDDPVDLVEVTSVDNTVDVMNVDATFSRIENQFRREMSIASDISTSIPQDLPDNYSGVLEKPNWQNSISYNTINVNQINVNATGNQNVNTIVITDTSGNANRIRYPTVGYSLY